MKRFILFTFSLLLTFTIAVAQDGINYQGAATDANGDELTNQNITIRASVLSTSANGNLEWEETHSATTDQFGLFNITIGQGTNTTNGATVLFDDMNWGSGNHFLKIEMDASGGTNYAMIGTTQMMSVPYALYAKSAGIDSTMLANMIGSSGGGTGGGCNHIFPDGLKGDPIIWHLPGNDYTVPSGKNLYITFFAGYGQGESLKIDGLEINEDNDFQQIIIVGAGSVVSTYSTNSGQSSNFNAILVDANVTPVVWHLPGNDYTVPSGKNLYITSFAGYGQGESLKIDGLEINEDNDFQQIIIVGAGSVVSTSSSTSGQWANFNGYLVDENYFAGCGGGGGSSSASAGAVSVSTFGDTLTINGQSIIVPGLSFQNMIPPLLGSVTDIDGNTYQTVSHGNIEIMAENLKVESFNNGDPIAEVCYCGGNVNSMCSGPGWTYYDCQASTLSYGRLYIGFTLNDSRNVCPSGWHIATGNEWKQLLDLFLTYLPSGNIDVSAILANQSNESGLSILLGGSQGPGGTGQGQGSGESIWYSEGFLGIQSIPAYFPQQYIVPNPNFNGSYDYAYIRCVKD